MLRYHNLVKAVAYPLDEKSIFKDVRTFLQSEGWLPAPESSYAIRTGIDMALKVEKSNEEKVICMNISGHGFLDLEAYKEKLFFDTSKHSYHYEYLKEANSYG